MDAMEQLEGSPGATLGAVLRSASEVLGDVGAMVSSLSGEQLAAVVVAADEVAAAARAAQVVVTAEAAQRGEFGSARRGAGSVHAWVREHARSLRQGGAGQVAQLAAEVAGSTPGGAWSRGGPDAGAFADPSRAEGVVWARVVTGEVSAGLALTALREVGRLKDLLVPEAAPTVAGAILDHGVRWGCREATKVRARLLARYGLEGELDRQQQRLTGSAFLSSPVVLEGDLSQYRLAMTPEQCAVLEAAIGPGSAPAPNAATGEADLRPAGQRRVEALTAVLMAAAGADSAGRDPAGAATVVHVTMSLAQLRAALAAQDQTSDARGGPGGREAQDQTSDARGGPGGREAQDQTSDARGRGDSERERCGTVLGSRAYGTVLAPGAVRRLSCDADVIPTVLGAHGEVVDVGRATRLFTRAQRRELWRRDRHCMFPDVTHRGCGRGRIMSCIGPTVVARICPTPPWCASDTTPWCTISGSSPRCTLLTWTGGA